MHILLAYYQFREDDSLMLLHGRKPPKYNNIILRPSNVDKKNMI